MSTPKHCAGLGDPPCAKRTTCARYVQWWTAPKSLPVDMYLCAGTHYARFMPKAGTQPSPATAPVGTTADLFGATA